MRSEAGHTRQRWAVNFNTVLAVACILFAVLLFAVIPSEVERPPVLFGQSSGGLDPAFFPQVVATCFLLVGIWYLRASFRLDEVNGFRGLNRHNYLSVGFTVLMFVVYAAILVPLGFILASALIIVVLSIFYGARSWPAIVLVAIGVPGVVYLVFRRMLGVALPELPDF